MSSEVAVEMFGGRRWKRYPAYRDSGVEWLGEVPEGWNMERLKYCATLINEKVDGRESNLPYTGLENIESWTGRLIPSEEISTSEGQSNIYEPEDVLFGKLRPYLAKVLSAKEHGICTGELLVLRPKDVSQDYLFRYMLARDFISIVDSSTYGAKMPRASWDFIGDLPVLLPTEAEQRAIAAFLDSETGRIDTLIEKKERQIKLLQEKRATLISHAVTKGLDSDVKMKDSGVEWLGEVPEKWELMKFRRVCRLQQGLQIAQSNRFGEKGPNRFEYITVKSIHANDTTNSKEYIENPTRSVICTTDDILLARTGATGEVISGQNGVFHNNFFKIIYDRKIVDKNYLIYYLSNTQIKKHLLLLAGTTTIPDLNHGEFLSTHFISPDIHEQQNIISFLNSETGNIDTLIDKIRQSISKLREYRTALISAAVTGKIDVRSEET